MKNNAPDEPATSWDLPAALGASLVLSGLFAIVLTAVDGWSWFSAKLDSSAPAWIQAIGSIAAIIAATAIASRQSQAAAQLEASKLAATETQRLLVVKALMARAHILSKEVCAAFATPAPENFEKVNPDLMLDTQITLKALPIFDIPHGILALDVLTMGRYLGEMRDKWMHLISTSKEGAETSAEEVADLATLAEEIRDVSLASLTLCNAEIAKRNRHSTATRTDA